MTTDSVTETILTQTISEFATTDFVEIADEANVTPVGIQVLTGGKIGLVKDSDNFPLGVLDVEVAARLIGKEGQLREHLSSLARIAVAPPETSVQKLMSAVQEIRSVRWIVLRSEGQNFGLVTPRSILKTFSLHFAQQSEQAAEAFWNGLRNSLIKAPPPADPIVCYCCSVSHHGRKPHRVQPGDVVTNVSGDDVCRDHPSTIVIPSIDCTLC